MSIPELILLTIGVANHYGLDADMFARLPYAESRYDQQAVYGQSVGLCQINLGAWQLEEWVVKTDDPYEPYANLMMGGYILSLMMERYKEPEFSDPYDPYRAVAAYTLGHGRLEELVDTFDHWWWDELDPEIREYVEFIVEGNPATRFGAWSWRDAIPAPEVRRRTPR